MAYLKHNNDKDTITISKSRLDSIYKKMEFLKQTIEELKSKLRKYKNISYDEKTQIYTIIGTKNKNDKVLEFRVL